MKAMPEKVKLSPKEVASLNKVQEKTIGLDSFVKTVMQQGEARLGELQTEQRDVWSAISKAHGIDLKAVDYALEGDYLVPMQMKL